MPKYYVYTYKNPSTNEIFYVGKGSGDRLYRHLAYTLETTYNKRFTTYLLELKAKGLAPTIEKYAEDLEEQEAYSIETSLIKNIGRMGLDDGGTLMNFLVDNCPPSTLKTLTDDEVEEIRKTSPYFGMTAYQIWDLTLPPEKVKEKRKARSLKASESQKGRKHKTSSKNKMKIAQKDANKGRKFIHHPITKDLKYVYPEEFETYFSKGYVLGKIYKNRKPYFLINNGSESKHWHDPSTIPNGWNKGSLPNEKSFSKLIGTVWITDGINSKQVPPDIEIPEGWRRGRK